jgi:hypothetical protein
MEIIEESLALDQGPDGQVFVAEVEEVEGDGDGGAATQPAVRPVGLMQSAKA